jgi:[CysO sulfur-carrier protein]-S-L-cysteine hydrolase
MGRGDLPALMQSLILTSKQWQSMRRHVDAESPLEACGLLAGLNSRVESVLEIRNLAQSSAHFVMDPKEQLDAFDQIESRGLELIGIYHSHPAGPEVVSVTDIAEATYAVVHVVWSRMDGEWRARGFWIENSQASEVTLQVE